MAQSQDLRGAPAERFERALVLSPDDGKALFYGDDDAPLMIDAGSSEAQPLRLPTQSASSEGPGWWGMRIFLLINASLYGSLLFAYFYLWLVAPEWPPPGHELPGLALPAVGLGLLLGGSVAMHWSQRRNALGRADGGRPVLLLAALLLGAFLVTQALQLIEYGQPPQSHAYASLIWVLVGYQGLHALVALLMAAFVGLRSRIGRVNAQRPQDIRVLALFWHYTTALWWVGMVLVHLFPRVV